MNQMIMVKVTINETSVLRANFIEDFFHYSLLHECEVSSGKLPLQAFLRTVWLLIW